MQDSRNDRGSLSLELAIAFPALLVLVMTAIQYGLIQHGRHVALAVAQRAAREGRAYAPTASDKDRGTMANSAGNPLLRVLGGSALSKGVVDTSVAGDTVTVVVTGYVQGPLGAYKVVERASGPIEQIEAANP